jgi:DNA-binding transcriptional regulator GbsR (MarR family)
VADVDAVAEKLALALNEAGMQRMVARVMAAFLFTDADSLTARDLQEQLDASAGSISAAIGMLRTVALVEPAVVPGSRRSHFRMREDAWSTLMTGKNATLGLMQEIAVEGLTHVEPGSPAHGRLTEMADFYRYLEVELPALMDRWHASRGERR